MLTRSLQLLKHFNCTTCTTKSPIFAAITVLQIANVVCLIVELLHIILVLKRKKTMVHQLRKGKWMQSRAIELPSAVLATVEAMNLDDLL